jgi:superfamily I DNA/RNA helicase/RecB family exonuclease
VELSAEQRQVVEHGAGPLRVRGRAGTGKTTALVGRYLRLAREAPPSRILFLCRSREAVAAARDAILPELAGGFDALPIATFGALCFDVLGRSGETPRRRVSASEQRAIVRELLAADDPSHWPTLGQFLERPAFVDEVLDGLAWWRTSTPATTDHLDEAWRELASFAQRYADALEARGAVDGPGLLAAAATAVAESPPPYEHVLVDDFEAATAATGRLYDALAATAASVCVAPTPAGAVGGRQGAGPRFFEALSAPEAELTKAFRSPSEKVLVRCNHPSVEPEVVAGELLAARAAGARWSDMAVLVRRPRRRARAITRALARHAIPVSAADAPLDDEPVVAAAVDMLRWAAGDDTVLGRLLASPLSGLDPVEVRNLRRRLTDGTGGLSADDRLAPLIALRDALQERLITDDPAALVFLVWERALGPLLVGSNDPADDRAIDAFVAFHDGLTREVERNPGLRTADWLTSLAGRDERWRTTRPNTDAVTVTSVAAAAGRQWHTVVVAGAVEGEFPAIDGHAPLFEPAVLSGLTPPTAAERRRSSLGEERRLFCEVASTRATAALVATSAPEPGVLESRFVGAWPPKGASIPLAPGQPPVVRLPTDGGPALYPDHTLLLSASQLETYEDCPLRYLYEYVLRVRGDSNVYAELGSLVHEVLAEFLNPEKDEVDYSLAGLLELGERMWRDDLARYRPQVEEARRDFFDMLERWWEAEGAVARPDVLAVERRFEVDVGPHRITGSIDRIDRIDGGLRIVDYKTGSKETPAAEMPDNLQLAVYHLAAARDTDLAAEGPATELDLVFLRNMKVRSQPVTDDHEAATEARILAVADSILAEQFEPSVHANCRVCDFHRLCPIQAAGRQVAPDV